MKTGLIEDEFAKLLGQAFDSRLDSDYDVAFTAGRTLAEEVSRDAQHFVARVEQYLGQEDALLAKYKMLGDLNGLALTT